MVSSSGRIMNDIFVGDSINDTFFGVQHGWYLHQMAAWVKTRCDGSRDIDIICYLQLIVGEEIRRNRETKIACCLPMIVEYKSRGVETSTLSAACC